MTYTGKPKNNNQFVVWDGTKFVVGSGKPTIVHVGSYVTTTAPVETPQSVGQVFFDPQLHQTSSCKLVTVMATTSPGTTASVLLYNATSGSYVEIGGPGIRYLHVTSSNALQVESINLFEAVNFTNSQSLYQVQTHVTGGVLSIIHYGSDLVFTGSIG